MLRILIILAVVAFLGFFCYSQFSTTQNHRVKYSNAKYGNDTTNTSPNCNASNNRNVPLLKKNSTQPENLVGLEILDALSTSVSVETFSKNFITRNNQLIRTKEKISAKNKYVKLKNGKPELSLSLNVPNLDCFLSTSFREVFEIFIPIQYQMNESGYNGLQGNDVSFEQLLILIFCMNMSISLLMQLASRNDYLAFPFDYDATKCKFVSRCNLNVQYSESSKFAIFVHFEKLKSKTMKLTPQLNNFRKSNSANLLQDVDFGELERSLRNVIVQLTASMISYQEKEVHDVESRVYAYLRQKIPRFDDIFAKQILDRHRIPNTVSSNESYFESENDDFLSDLDTYTKIPCYFKKEHIEITSFVLETQAYHNLSMQSSSLKFGVKSSIFTVSDQNYTTTYGKSFHYKRFSLPNYETPSVARANREYVEGKLAKKSDEESGEFNLRNIFQTGLTEYFDLIMSMEDELQ